MIRRPRIQDVPAIVAMINARAGRGEILPRSTNYVYQNLRDFVVAEEGGEVVACGGLHVLWRDLGEIRALASLPSAPPDAEREIVHALLEGARKLGLPKVFAFASFPEFFVELGFAHIAKESLPRQAWHECIDCVKFLSCDETPVSIDL